MSDKRAKFEAAVQAADAALGLVRKQLQRENLEFVLVSVDLGRVVAHVATALHYLSEYRNEQSGCQAKTTTEDGATS